ncbi:hypothetical protein ACM6PT_49135, partial [Klebsiella pneumoniae]
QAAVAHGQQQHGSRGIAGHLAAGLLLQDFYEDWQPHPRFVIDRFMPTFLATCALKPRSAAG